MRGSKRRVRGEAGGQPVRTCAIGDCASSQWPQPRSHTCRALLCSTACCCHAFTLGIEFRHIVVWFVTMQELGCSALAMRIPCSFVVKQSSPHAHCLTCTLSAAGTCSTLSARLLCMSWLLKQLSWSGNSSAKHCRYWLAYCAALITDYCAALITDENSRPLVLRQWFG